MQKHYIDSQRLMADMVNGYRDGNKPDTDEPGDNRTYSYKHGFQNGRDDLLNKPRASAQVIREAGEAAIRMDIEKLTDV